MAAVESKNTEMKGVPDLSPRQRQILSLLRAGSSNKDISASLNIGIGTVKQHLVVLFRKLGVTSRTAAVSKSIDMDVMIKGPDSISVDAFSAAETTLERRPVAVVSLRVEVRSGAPSADGVDDTAIRQQIHQTFSDVGFEFGAVYFTHADGRCDLIFGVRQARRHDGLRAVRAAFSVHERLTRGHGGDVMTKGAVACGTVIASTTPTGDWSGEVLAGIVITNAQTLAQTAPANTLLIDGTARGMIDYLELGLEQGVPQHVSINDSVTWQQHPQPAPNPLFGRTHEHEILRSRLYKLRGGAQGILRIIGETGMGKTALISAFCDFASRESMPVTDRLTVAIPDSQPRDNALGKFEAVGEGGVLLSVSDVAARLRKYRPDAPHIIVIDDAHLLNTEVTVQLSEILQAYQTQKVLFVLAHRGPDPLKETPFAGSESVRLTRLKRDDAYSLATARSGPDAPFLSWAVAMAAGVPGFITQICDYLKLVRPGGSPDLTLMPPLTLFSMIAERLEGLGLDRQVLHILVRNGTPCVRKKLLAEWTGSEDAVEAVSRMTKVGVIEIDDADGISFRHPLVGWVAQHMSVSGGAKPERPEP